MRNIMGLMRDTYGYMSVLRDSLRDAERDLEGASLVDQCVHHHQCKRGYDNLKKALTDIYKLVDKQSKVAIPESMDDAGVDKIRVPEVETSFYPLVKYSASMLDREKAFQYLRDNNAEALITETVNASSLSGYLRDRIINEGIEPPEDVFNFNIYKITGMSKYTPK